MPHFGNDKGKVSKAEAGYSDNSHSDVKLCSECAYFVYPDRCEVVAGEISPEGLSNLFEFSIEKKSSLVMAGFMNGIKKVKV